MPATPPLAALVRRAAPGPDAVSDPELLDRFARSADQAAFELLVWRHGGMVWGVCRRMLAPDRDAAEDACQAAFVALAAHAARVRDRHALGPWLHRVAVRAALDLAAARRAIRPLPADQPDPPARDAGPVRQAIDREVRSLLDAGLNRLPDKLRLPFVLCELEGRSNAEAAAALGCPVGTVESRLTRARRRLRDWLAARGVVPAVAVAAVAVPDAVRAAMAGAGGSAQPSRAVRDLAARAVPPTVSTSVRTAAAFVLTACTAGLGVALTQGPKPADPPPAPQAANPQPRLDRLGDPLPDGAVARLGSARWRHEGEAKSMDFSPDGKALAVVSGNDGAITIFETATGKPLHRVPGPDDSRQGPTAIAFSPDGGVLAARLDWAKVQLWDAKTLKPLRTLTPPEGGTFGSSMDQLRFSHDGKRLAVWTGPQDTVTVWDVAASRQVAGLTGHNHANPAMAFSPDGKAVFLGVSNPDVQLWDAATGKYLRGFDTGEPAFSLAVSADGATVASGGRNRIVLSDVKTGKEVARLEGKMSVVSHLAFTPDGKSLVALSAEAKVWVWDVATKKERHVLNSRGWMGKSMALSADGKTVAAGGMYNLVRLWDVASGKELFPQADSHDAPVHAVAFSPDGRLLVTGGANQQIRVWDAATLREVGRLKGASARQASFSADGRRLATAWEWGDRARVWDEARGEQVLELHPTAERCPCAAFTPDGKSVVTAAWRKGGENFGRTLLQTWDAATGKPLRELTLPGLDPYALAVSPDGRLAAVGGASGNGSDPGDSLRLCDLAGNRERAVRRGDMSYVGSVAFSPDGRFVATGSIDLKTRLWEVATGREVLTLAGHGRCVAAVAFAPGGRVLATADGGPISRYWDGTNPPQTIRFWDVVTGKELARLGGHGSDVTSLAFTPDGKRLVAGLHNGTALVWDTPAAARPPAVPVGRKLGPKELAALFDDLAGEDAAVGYEAVRILAASPDHSVPFLAARLQPVAAPSGEQVRKLVAQLGAEAFADREAAQRELRDLGEAAAPGLRGAVKGGLSPEQARRVNDLLAAADAITLAPGERLRAVRAVAVLERVGTKDARELLAALAKGAAGARLTREAGDALKRIGG